MAVLGIDTNSFGFHVVADVPIRMPGAEDAPPDRVTSPFGWLVVKGLDAQQRRHLVFTAARRFFQDLPAGASVFIEEPLVLPKNIETTRKLVMMGGVLEAAFFNAKPDAVLHWVDVATWRKHVLGKGSGKKEFMKELAKRRTLVDLTGLDTGVSIIDSVLDYYDDQPDLYDAHCIMLYGRGALAQ